MASFLKQQKQIQKSLVQPEAQNEPMPPPPQQAVTEMVPHQKQQASIESSTLKLPSIESTIIDIPSSSTSSSYDTDSSTASSTCCTRHGEHIYMERIPTSATSTQRHLHLHQHNHHRQQQQQQQHHAAALAADTDALHFKADHKKSWPIFILVISIIEIAIFIYDSMSAQRHTEQQQTQDLSFVSIPTDSVFIYRPDRRLEVWRFISYMFLHANWFHLGFNVVVQLFYGIPLEVMHGSARVAIIYFAGVFAGSLGTSVVDSEVYLVGASGGVYALLAAHLANITLNYGQMQYAVAQLLSVVIFVSCDLGYAFYTQYLAVIEFIKTPAAVGGGGAAAAPPVSYIAHLTGALAGLTIGLLVLKNFERRAYENLIWWLALGIYSAFTVFAIVFNLINTMTAQMMEEQGEVITQHLLHDLGVS